MTGIVFKWVVRPAPSKIFKDGSSIQFYSAVSIEAKSLLIHIQSHCKSSPRDSIFLSYLLQPSQETKSEANFVGEQPFKLFTPLIDICIPQNDAIREIPFTNFIFWYPFVQFPWCTLNCSRCPDKNHYNHS